jgi:hypothetical protein
MEKEMRNKISYFNEVFEEGTLAFSDRIVCLTDDDLLEDDFDEDIEVLLVCGKVS